MLRFSALFLLSSLVAAPAIAQQRPAHDAQNAPLRGFRAPELRLISTLLPQGTVVLVEHATGGTLPGIHLARIVRAPAPTIAAVVSQPENYPSFMPAVSDVTVHDHANGVVGFAWQWTSSIFRLGGEVMLTLYSPPAAHPERGYRVSIERTEGDLGRGRDIWRIIPRGPNESLVLLSTRVDLRDQNPLMRQVGRGTSSLNRSINLAMGFATLLRSSDEAERRAGHARPAIARALRRPTVDLDRLDPLLRRGDMLLIESNGTELRQTSVMTRLDQPEEHIRGIMLDPIAFTEALIAGSHATIRETTADGVVFDWGVDIPLMGTSGAMSLAERPDRSIHLRATDGAMSGGEWRFQTQRMRRGGTGVLGWASFDVRTANFVLRAIIDADEAFCPGLSAATELMMARALRIRARRPLRVPDADSD